VNTKLTAVIAIFLIISLPFIISDNNDDIEPKRLDSSTVGYYQSTTCNISLLEFINENENQEFYFNNNNYADINCFGKITGVDLVKNKYFISIGTNTSITLIIQSSIWLLLFFFIPKHKESDDLSIYIAFFIPFIFCLQLFAEERFYNRTNILFSNDLNISNYYLLGNVLFYLLFGFLCFELFKNRYKNLLNFLPFTFLLIGTFSGMNLNIYLMVLSYFGLISILRKNINSFDYLYLGFSIIWLINIQSNDYFFDGDKLRGFINSNLNMYSQFFWIIIFYLTVKGILFLVERSINYFDELLFLKNLMISGSLIVLFGLLGSYYPFFNFFNFLIFGQNKRGMKTLESIDGNTWRGFSASAESIGEFYGLIILFLFLLFLLKKEEINPKYFIFLVPILFGLYKSNNFAAFLSLILIILLILTYKYLSNVEKQKSFFLFFTIFSILIFSIFIFNSDYQYLSSELLFESTLHQGFYENPGSYENFKIIEKKMFERDLNTILLTDDNFSKASTSYRFLVNLFTSNLNIPFVPNIVGLISVISLLINRTEMWGIFIAKFDPNNFEALFGSGPQQFNEYLYGEKIYLDVPDYKMNSLYLPHSSLLDFMIFFGTIGTGIILTYVFYKLYKSKNKLFVYLTAYLLINLLKSDSILYLNSFILTTTCIALLSKIKEEKFYER
tara:strand:- start:742 stop:2757 length:2016 start_codon:yes stop_codon:yes gene_type:complete